MTEFDLQAKAQHLRSPAACAEIMCHVHDKDAGAHGRGDEHCSCCRVKQALPGLVKELLAPHGLTPSDCCFAVHTGGPKILEKTAAALGVTSDSMQVAYCTPF